MNFNLNYSLPVGMAVLLDILVIVTAALAGWRGWRKGIIGGLCALVSIIVAFYGANLIASTYSGEFTGIVEPFADGIIESTVTRVTGNNSAEAEDGEEAEAPEETAPAESLDDEQLKRPKKKRPLVVILSDEEKTDVYSVSFAVLRQLGLHEDTADAIAKSTAGVADYVNSDMSEFLARKLSATAAYVGVFVIAFVLIVVIFAVLGNVLDLVFSLPGIELVNKILGLALGLALAFCVLQFFGCITRFIGIVLPDETVGATRLFKYFVENNYLAAFIGL